MENGAEPGFPTAKYDRKMILHVTSSSNRPFISLMVKLATCNNRFVTIHTQEHAVTVIVPSHLLLYNLSQPTTNIIRVVLDTLSGYLTTEISHLHIKGMTELL